MKYISIDQIELWEDVNVRKTDKYIDIEELATNIREVGVQSPLIVKPKGASYLVISGQRRLIAAKKAGLKEVPCIVRNDIRPIDALVVSFSENLYRLDMNDDDKADAAFYLLNKLGSVGAVARKLGVSPTTVRGYLAHKNLPKNIKAFVTQGKMTSTVAREIVNKFTDPKDAYEMAKLYATSPTDQKPDIYASIKQSTTSDTPANVRRRAKAIGGAVGYRILLPRPTSNIIRDIAKTSSQKEPVIIAQIVEDWVDGYRRGKVKFR